VPVQDDPPEKSGCNKKIVFTCLICLLVVIGAFVAINLPFNQEDKLIRSSESDLKESETISESLGDKEPYSCQDTEYPTNKGCATC